MSRTLPRPIFGSGRSLVRTVFMEKFHLLRKWNELVLLRDRRKAAGLPVLLGLLDPLFTRRDEIPPDVARAFQRIAAQEHHPCRRDRLDRDTIAGPKDQKARACITLVGDLDFAV